MGNVAEFAADAIAIVAAKAPKPHPDDFIGEDGLIHCRKCGTRKQYVLDFAGKQTVVPVMCACRKAEVQKEENERKNAATEASRAKREELFSTTFPTDELKRHTFPPDTESDSKQIAAMRKYTQNFPRYAESGQGLLLWGDTGSGKTYAASCIVNALTEQNILCRFITLRDAEATARAGYEGTETLLKDLSNRRLVVLDEFETGIQSEYVSNLVYAIVNTCYNAAVPLIVTTNATLDEIKNPRNQRDRRVCERILEKCFPVNFTGNYRRANLRRTYDTIREELGL